MFKEVVVKKRMEINLIWLNYCNLLLPIYLTHQSSQVTQLAQGGLTLTRTVRHFAFGKIPCVVTARSFFRRTQIVLLKDLEDTYVMVSSLHTCSNDL